MKVLVALLAAGAIALGWLVVRPTADPRGIEPPPVVTDELSSDSAAPELTIARSPVEAVPVVDDEGEDTSLREYLAEYWGDRWPQQEAAMEAAGLDLDQEFEITAWEDAAAELEKHLVLSESARASHIQGLLQWPEVPTREALQTSLPVVLPEEDVIDVIALAEPYNDRLREIGQRWVTSLEANIFEHWSRGLFQRAPFTTVGLEPKTGFHAQSIAGRGWAAVIVLTEEDCPDMQLLYADLEEVRQQRFAAIMTHLRR